MSGTTQMSEIEINKDAIIMTHIHQTAPTQFIEANGIRFAYRRFGKAGGVPLVFNQHYLGTMDYWDPTVTDGLARDREVILFDNAGVSSSSGAVPTTFEQMGANAKFSGFRHRCLHHFLCQLMRDAVFLHHVSH